MNQGMTLSPSFDLYNGRISLRLSYLRGVILMYIIKKNVDEDNNKESV